MPPQPPETTAPGRRPRHAAEPDLRPSGVRASEPRYSGLGTSAPRISGPGTSGSSASGLGTSAPRISGPGTSGSSASGLGTSAPRISGRASRPGMSADELNGRHRRPESLADANRPRSAPAASSGNPRPAGESFVPGSYADSFIERGFAEAPRFPEMSRAQRRAIEAIQLAERRRIERSTPSSAEGGRAGRRRRTDARRAVDHRAVDHRPADRRITDHRAADRGRRAGSTGPGGGRGKHAAAADPAITVRPLPAVRDAVVDGLPAAWRAAGAVREWALATGDKPPVMGAHRAPGTLPIESWLLVGRARQQMLLATLVAAGLAL